MDSGVESSFSLRKLAYCQYIKKSGAFFPNPKRYKNGNRVCSRNGGNMKNNGRKICAIVLAGALLVTSLAGAQDAQGAAKKQKLKTKRFLFQ